MPHRLGHALLVILVACLCLTPARAEAATIELGTASGTTFDFSGVFGADNDVALIFISLLGTAEVSAEMTSQLETPAGFDPILTLFGPGTEFRGAFDFLSENAFGLLDPMTLAAGNYVLALTQYNNFYAFTGGFEYDGANSGDLTAILSGGVTTCAEFVDLDGNCRTANFAGSLSIQPENVPEPGSLALLMVGGAALLVRRRRWRRPDASDRA
jgi:hypothetical protein